MKRSAFLASFLGVLGISQAQQWKGGNASGTPDSAMLPDGSVMLPNGTVVSRHFKPGKALNNQCPVCGTMAKPYRAATGGMTLTGTVRIDPPGDMPRLNLARCLRCSAAFWQDSEDKK